MLNMHKDQTKIPIWRKPAHKKMKTITFMVKLIIRIQWINWRALKMDQVQANRNLEIWIKLMEAEVFKFKPMQLRT